MVQNPASAHGIERRRSTFQFHHEPAAGAADLASRPAAQKHMLSRFRPVDQIGLDGCAVIAALLYVGVVDLDRRQNAFNLAARHRQAERGGGFAAVEASQRFAGNIAHLHRAIMVGKTQHNAVASSYKPGEAMACHLALQV